MQTVEDSASEQAAVRVNRVSRKFGKREVLHDITLEVRPSEVFGLLGPSGSGKTTLIKVIAGLDKATTGEVFMHGVRMPNLSMLGRIGYMAQSDALYTDLTGRENLGFFASMFGLSGQEKKRRMEEVMTLVNLVDAMPRLVAAYSGGMKRRLSLAIALLHQPDLLILDEPTVGIDPSLRRTIWAELHTLCAQGTTIIVTTHVMDEAEQCHRLGMVRDGYLIATGTPAELKAQTKAPTLEEAFLTYGGGRQ
ncbi:ABC transporter ATP-binding protein [Alicyclobacillus cycloheptanicus]|uniref:ABC-2 type transport system ATP-binding protein n=1 Tax=Alicyclobacillus cycloheptanicus TaxID=1457 RepID=A0ABT9XKM3_9BACL|nr:ABC transporter ATP-binding protein [Alicyclobacillus cycloheptanicus]MDQ0190291.1 ABC-2 type transport system ATP-binding protein [Alicyclobacillus cycloheptanicus]